MSLKKTFIYSYSTIILGILCVGILDSRISYYQGKLNEKYEQRYQSSLLADELRQSSDELTRMARTYVVTKDPKYEQIYWDILAIRNGQKARPEAYNRIYWDLVLNYGEKPRPDTEKVPLQTLMKEAGFTEEEFAKLREAEQNSNDLVVTETIAMNAIKGLYNDGKGNYTKRGEPNQALAIRIMHDQAYHENKAKIMKPIDEFLLLLEQRTEKEVLTYKNKAQFLSIWLDIILVTVTILSITVAILVSRSILAKVGGEPDIVVEKVKQIAEGDLTVQIENSNSETDSILGSMLAMEQQLRRVVANVQGVVNNVIIRGRDIKSTSHILLEGSSNQATATQEAAITMGHMTETIGHNAENAQNAELIALKVSEDAEKTGAVMLEALNSIQQIASQITVIEDITLQTQMLSLNASIEASRSKEHGKGFAVIASEIRALALRSQESATQINQLASSTVAITEKAGKMLSSLVPDIQKTATLVQQISHASQMQNNNTEQINIALQQLQSVTQNNSQIANSVTDIAEELSLQAQSLQEAIAYFQVQTR